MTGRLILIAHAETEAVRQARFSADEGISASGRATATAYKSRVPAAEAVFVSPARAAVETAVTLGLAAETLTDLRDLDVGAWAGRAIRDVAATEPQALAAWRADPAVALHGGEPIAALLARVDAWLATRQTHKGATLAVTPSIVCRAAVVSVLEAPYSAFWAVDIDPLGRVVLTSDGRRWSLRELGRHSGC